MTIDMEATGKLLKQRMQYKASATEWSEMLGFSTVQPIYKWWQGKNLPTIDNLVIIASELGVMVDDILVINGKARMMRAEDRYYSDDITWCMAECKTDCPRQPRYIRDKTIPHSYADFSNVCMGYEQTEPKGEVE